MKKSLIALATASAVAFAGVGVAGAQDGATDPKADQTQTNALQSSNKEDDASGSVNDFFGWKDGYVKTADGTDSDVLATTTLAKIKSVGDLIKAIATIVGNVVSLLKNLVGLGEAIPMPK